ncbi:MAG: FkbM family methyltransferase [Candidatus Lokiarchaeota archaeon]|nr:FkbM family methyltransferase [Candidatus Lokiarchaeota archaeon]
MNRIKLNKGPIFPAKLKNKISLAHNINYFFLKFTFKGSERIRKTISKLLIPKPKGETIWPTVYGFNFFLNFKNKNIIEQGIYRYGAYEAGIINVIRNYLKPGDTFMDIGSNIGIISLAASQIVGDNGHIYSFEPEPDTFFFFKKNISLNNIKNITAFKHGLGSIKETKNIYYHEEYGNSTFIKLENNKNKPIEKKVFIDTLDNVIKDNNIKRIKMIKIDVEGWEFEVLKGAERLLKSKNAPIISIEYFEGINAEGGLPINFVNYISSINNYKIYKLKKSKEFISDLIEVKNKEDLPHSNENLFCFLPHHLK